jgi:uncharacterized protein (TIGR03435 family)
MMNYAIRRGPLTLGIALTVGVLIGAQAPDPVSKPLSFDVAAITPNRSGDEEFGSYVEPGGRYTARNVTLHTLIKTAYGVHDSQIAGGAAWIGNDRWDIVAKAEGYAQPAAFRDTARLMLRPLLADRFRLSLRHEQRELRVYALVVAKANGEVGPQFRRNDERECDRRVPPIPPVADAKEPAVPLPCGADMFRPGHLAARDMTVNHLVVALNRFNIDRVVVDQTRLKGKFDWEIQWTPEALTVADVAAREGPTVFDAFREQAGLRLQPKRAPVDVLVIDHVERPTPD